MLSDEERKAIEKLSAKKNESTWNDTIRQIKREEIKDVVVTRQKYITTVLNLIEKQSKEIEELKNKYEEIYNEIDNKNSQLVKALNYKLFIEDKIKAKIEELEKLQKEFPNNDEIRIKIIAYKELLEKDNIN